MSNTTFKVTLLLTCEGHPRKWLPEQVAGSLYGESEDLLDYEIEESNLSSLSPE